MSASKRARVAARPAQDHAPNRTRQRSGSTASTVPSPVNGRTSAAGRARTASPVQGQVSAPAEPLSRAERKVDVAAGYSGE
jgi:hypothetical protein